MNVAYDISVLGAGFLFPRARTGVFRVVENIAQGLANAPECNLSFLSTQEHYSIRGALGYLAENSQLSEIPLTTTQTQHFSEVLQKRISTLNSVINSQTTASLTRAYSRLTRRSTFLAKQILDQHTNYFVQRHLRNTDIFHSPFYPIPQKFYQLKNLKLFITVHDLIPLLFPDFFRMNEDRLTRTVLDSISPETYIFCVSQSTKNDLCNYSKNIDPEKISVTHLAASELFYPCTDKEAINAAKLKYGIPLESPYILSLSTLEPRKNIDQTIRCFTQLVQQEQITDLKLVLVGTKGWNYDKIFAEIDKSNHLKAQIILTGYVADEDLAALYSGAQMFVYPSLYEGFGLPPLEAMQCGVPVITSNTSSLPEVVGEAGMMVDPKDADGLCQSLLNLYQQPRLRELMAQKSLEQARKFSWQQCTQETIRAYQTAIEQH